MSNDHNELVVYIEGKTAKPVHIAFDGETMWLTQDQIAALFDTSRPNVVQHIQNIYNEGELDPETTSKKILQVVEKRPRYAVIHYNLDVIISVGYRVSSSVATKFRQWATSVIKERIASSSYVLGRDQQRVMISDRIAVENNELLQSAAEMGVVDMPLFYDSGYQGMYGMRSPEIKKHKGIGTDRVLDRAGITELAANEFRITQTNEKLQALLAEDKVVGHVAAITTHYMVGREVREAIERIGGVPPEDLLPEPEPVEVVRKRIKGSKSKEIKG